jgi:hypothetical protein
VGTTIIVFTQFLSGSVFLAIAQSIFQGRLLVLLQQKAPNENGQAIVAAGATAVRGLIAAPEDLSAVLQAYNTAVTETFVSFRELFSGFYNTN